VKSWRRPAVGVIVAIGITTAMDYKGLSAFSALPLLPLMLLFWYLERFSRTEIGFSWGRVRHYGVALLHPVLLLGLLVSTASLWGAINLERKPAGKRPGSMRRLSRSPPSWA
jgi:hypothetical protein